MGPKPTPTIAPADQPWSGGDMAVRYDCAGNRAFYQSVLARLLDGAPGLTSGRVLDLGCGTGFSTEILLQRFPDLECVGVDVSAPVIARAQSKPALARTRFVHAAAESLPFEDGHFDLVVSNFAWHWFGETARQEVARVLRPGGWLLVSAPLRQLSRASGNRWLARELLASRHHLHRAQSQGFRLDDLARALPTGLCVRRLDASVIDENFASARELLDTLDSRGSLFAIFGSHPPAAPAGGALEFEWHVGLVHAQR
jgi:SAM-dependent methyltransferase